MSRRCWMILVLLAALTGRGSGAFPSPAPSAPLSLWTLFASPPPASSVPRFSITDLGTLGGGSSTAGGVNDLGQVAGSSLTESGVEHAFLFSEGKLTDLGAFGNASSEAFAINNQGHVVGQSLTAGQAAQHAFLYSGGKMIDLKTLGGLSSSAGGINDADQVVGYSFTSVQGYSFTNGIGATHAFLYSSGRMADLGTLGGATSVGTGINAMGQVVGNSFVSTNSARHAILYSDRQRIDLKTLGGLNSVGNGINALGQVVGNSFITGNAAFLAFLYRDGKMSALSTLGGANSSANGINAIGQVVGESDVSPGIQHAFLWQESGMTDLNTLIPAGSGWELSRAMSISDGGEIVGSGLQNGETHGFLLTPTDAQTLTLQEASDTRGAIDRLITQVGTSAGPAGTATPRMSYLVSKLQAARERVARGNVSVTLHLLQSVVTVVPQLTDREMPPGKRQALIDAAQAIIGALVG